jgi:hypothetical protein
MDPRLEALSGIASVAVLFVPLFLAIFAARTTGQQIRAARERRRRIAAYRQSPESQLLRLT